MIEFFVRLGFVEFVAFALGGIEHVESVHTLYPRFLVQITRQFDRRLVPVGDADILASHHSFEDGFEVTTEFDGSDCSHR